MLVVLPSAALAYSSGETLPELQLAYIDPGAGSFVVQALIAMVAGIAVTGRLYWSKIKGMLGLAAAADEDDDEVARSDDD